MTEEVSLNIYDFPISTCYSHYVHSSLGGFEADVGLLLFLADKFELLYTFSKLYSSLGLTQEKAPYNKEAAARKATYETAKKKYDQKDSKVKFCAYCRSSNRLG